MTILTSVLGNQRVGRRIQAFLHPRRSDQLELLDDPSVVPTDLRWNLRDIRFLNRWFGGTLVAYRLVRQATGDTRRASLLDVATGSADIPRLIFDRLRRNGIEVESVAVDVSPEILAIAQDHVGSRQIELQLADARNLPFADERFDTVTCCLALHHFSPPEAIAVLRELWRVARHTIIVVDLRRSRSAYIGTWIATRTVARNHLTRHDGPLSVLRAYTPTEMNLLAQRAGIAAAVVRTHPFFRLSLVARKGTATSG